MFSDKIAYLKDINLHKSIINLSLFGCRVLFLFDLCGFLSLKHAARRVMNAKTPISSKYKAKKGLRFQTDTKPPGHQWMSRRIFEFMGGLGYLGANSVRNSLAVISGRRLLLTVGHYLSLPE